MHGMRRRFERLFCRLGVSVSVSISVSVSVSAPAPAYLYVPVCICTCEWMCAWKRTKGFVCVFMTII